MPNEQLLAHIRSELARGVGKTNLVQSLLAVGWKMEDINTAIANVELASSQSVPITPQTQGSQHEAKPVVLTVKYAGLWVRVAATLIDSLVIGVPYLLIILVISFANVENGEVVSMLVYSTIEIFAYAYYVLMLATYQATLGKMAVGLRVERTNGEKIGLWRAALREVVGKFVSGIIIGIGFFMVGWTQKKQGLHDKIADTVVIEKDPNKSKTVWIIIAVVMTLALPVIGTFAAITLASLNTARIKGADAAVKSHMSTVAVDAELYYDTVYEGYLGYCTSPEALAALADASRSGSTDESDTFYICNDTKEAYAASAPLKSGGYVCVDSMGASASAVVEELLPIGSYSCSLTRGNLLSGSDKDDFIRESINGCIESAVNNPSYDGISSPSISSYCSCVSNKIADETTNEEIKEIADLSEDAPLPSYMQERVDAANDVCGVLLEQ